MKAVEVRREHHQDWRDRAERLHALDHVARADLLNEFLEKTKGELFCDQICHQKSAPLRLGNGADLLAEFRLHFWLPEIA